jgi:ketosteroid isomerase-like protein
VDVATLLQYDIFAIMLSIPTTTAVAVPIAQSHVWAAEKAFANTMRERNLITFGQFISPEAIFFSSTTVLRGSAEVIAGWAPYFAANQAPFSWEPDQVEVLESGTLALSTGPVIDASGKVIARFNSVWRLEDDNHWRVVFDKGGPASPPQK